MLVIRCDVVTFDDTHRVVEGGAILVGDDGRVVDVLAAGAPVPAAFADARVVTYDGYAYPGLVDLHNHIPYNTIGLWTLARQKTPWVDHNAWTRPREYSEQITAPQVFLGWAAGPELLTYVETKALIAGTTTLQGNGKARPPLGLLCRNLDTETFGSADRFRVATIPPFRPADLDSVRRQMTDDGIGYILHLAEGLRGEAMSAEWDMAFDNGVVQDTFVGIHGLGLARAELKALQKVGATLVWSPFSNMWLYGATADIVTARALGLRICLGSDWAPSGTRNVLGELKVASLWNSAPQKWFDPARKAPKPPAGGVFTDRDLCDLVTRNPGDAIAQVYGGPEIGRLQQGYLADLVLIARRDDDPYKNLVAATEPDVELVLVDGEPRCGTASLMKAAGAKNAHVVTYRSRGTKHSRSVVLRNPARPAATFTWSHVTGRLEEVRDDPAAADQQLAAALAAADAGRADRVFVVEGDMPFGTSDRAQELAAGGAAVKPKPVPIPPIDPLVHDAAWFDAVDANSYHRGLLSPLRAFYP
ncbi:hypothetical protein ACIB24_00500 [Spongisporangium articulatum]|uniref:Amidohydrolase n=1 Tax=Spongisporangium articulatum TaxID=3362603 RepID=A0ABW8AGQ9_9ACTN